MLTKEELRRIQQSAYLPEHLPDYVQAVSGATPYFIENVLFFLRRQHLIFIGYPLKNTAADVEGAYTAICQKYNPAVISIIAPKIWLPDGCYERQSQDHYYRLDLPLGPMDREVAYMIRRAQRELQVAYGKFGRQHQKLVRAFLKQHHLPPEQIYLFEHIPHYLKRSKTAWLLEARKDNALVAFNILDSGAADYSFYLFNFRSTKFNVPGASDLLFREMVDIAQSNGKKAINLGLGINAGIRRFKEKWGGVPFLSYETALVHRQKLDLDGLAQKL